MHSVFLKAFAADLPPAMFPSHAMKRWLLRFTPISSLVFGLFVAIPVHAQSVLGRLRATGNIAYGGTPPATDITGVISNLVTTVIGLLGIAFFLLLLYAGFLYLTALGDEDKVAKAKRLIASGVIGMIIILSAYAVASYVESQVAGSADVITSGATNAYSQSDQAAQQEGADFIINAPGLPEGDIPPACIDPDVTVAEWFNNNCPDYY